jgi:hypothetical protein
VRLRGSWEECCPQWSDESGIVVPSAPAAAGRTAGEEAALRILFSLLAKHVQDRKDFRYFAVEALRKVYRWNGDHIEEIVRQLIGEVKTILPEIDDLPRLSVNFWLIIAHFVAESYQTAVRFSWLFENFARSGCGGPVVEFLKYFLRGWGDAEDEPSLTPGRPKRSSDM